MSRINFFTPVEYQQPSTWMQKLEGAVDSYFYLGGRSVRISPNGNEAHLVESKTSTWRTTLKIISYMTLILPTLALTIKFAFRCSHSFHAVKKIYPNGTVIEGEFSNGKLIRGIFNWRKARYIIAPHGFCNDFPNFGNAPYNGPTVNFVEFMHLGLPQFIPVQKTRTDNTYESYNNSLTFQGAKQATMDALFLMAQDPLGTNDIGRVLDHPNLKIESKDFLIALSQTTAEGDQKHYHMIATSAVMLEVLKRDPEGAYIQVDDALLEKWQDSPLDELRQELQRRQAPAQGVG